MEVGSNWKVISSVEQCRQAISSGPPTQLIVVYFYAPTCPHCMKMTPQVKTMSRFFPLADFLYVDVHQTRELVEQHQLIYTPTFLLYKSSKFIDRIEGAEEKGLTAIRNWCTSESAGIDPPGYVGSFGDTGAPRLQSGNGAVALNSEHLSQQTPVRRKSRLRSRIPVYQITDTSANLRLNSARPAADPSARTESTSRSKDYDRLASRRTTRSEPFLNEVVTSSGETPRRDTLSASSRRHRHTEKSRRTSRNAKEICQNEEANGELFEGQTGTQTGSTYGTTTASGAGAHGIESQRGEWLDREMNREADIRVQSAIKSMEIFERLFKRATDTISQDVRECDRSRQQAHKCLMDFRTERLMMDTDAATSVDRKIRSSESLMRGMLRSAELRMALKIRESEQISRMRANTYELDVSDYLIIIMMVCALFVMAVALLHVYCTMYMH